LRLAVTGQTILVIVPARGGSKRLPGKNLKHLAGRPLLDFTADALAQSGLELPCLLSTDDASIAKRGRDLGWLVPFLRPAELATDKAATAGAVLHALDWFSKNHFEPDTIMLLQPTSPFRGGECLKEAVTLLAEKPEASAVVGMSTIIDDCKPGYAHDGNGYIRRAACEQDIQFVPNGAVYLIKVDVLRAGENFFPPGTIPLLMNGDRSVDIDTVEDWARAERMLAACQDASACH
jgi:CMP-N,N'-diacetyllegionaminic acid synthase